MSRPFNSRRLIDSRNSACCKINHVFPSDNDHAIPQHTLERSDNHVIDRGRNLRSYLFHDLVTGNKAMHQTDKRFLRCAAIGDCPLTFNIDLHCEHLVGDVIRRETYVEHTELGSKVSLNGSKATIPLFKVSTISEVFGSGVGVTVGVHTVAVSV